MYVPGFCHSFRCLPDRTADLQEGLTQPVPGVLGCGFRGDIHAGPEEQNGKRKGCHTAEYGPGCLPFPWPGHEQEEQSCKQEYVCAGRQPDSQIDLQHGAGKDQKQHRCTCTGQKRHSRQGKHHDDQQKHGRPDGLGVRDREMIIQIGVGCFTGIEKTVQDALHPQPGSRQKKQQNQGQKTGKGDDQQPAALHTLSGRTWLFPGNVRHSFLLPGRCGLRPHKECIALGRQLPVNAADRIARQVCPEITGLVLFPGNHTAGGTGKEHGFPGPLIFPEQTVPYSRQAWQEQGTGQYNPGVCMVLKEVEQAGEYGPDCIDSNTFFHRFSNPPRRLW